MKKNIYSLIKLSASFFIPTCFTSYAQETRPNLIYIFPDQFRKTSMNFWDNPKFRGVITTKADPVHTPNLTEFASEAVVFTNAVSNCPLSSPHRASLMTGLFPATAGVPLNVNSTRPISSLREDIKCFSDILVDSNYDLGYIGKWHLDFPTPNDPDRPGHYVDPRVPAWDTYSPIEKRHGFNFWYAYGTWNVHKNPHYYDKNGKRHEPMEWSPKHEADMAIEYLKNENAQRDPNKPFALFVSMNPPHSPYQSLEDCMEDDFNLYKDIPLSKLLIRRNVDLKMKKSKSAPYYFANVTGVDREFGRIIQQLKEQDLYDNTIIVFTSDHGETLCSQGIEDAKNSIYNESFEVPLLIRYPKLKKCKTDNLLIGTPDLMPTLLGLMGLENQIPQSIHGFNYAHQIEKPLYDNRPRSQLYIRNIDGENDQNGKIISYFPEARGIKNHRYTLELTINQENKLFKTKFFDNKRDPYQLNNIQVSKQDPVVKELLIEMGYWLKLSDDKWYQEKILSNWIDY